MSEVECAVSSFSRPRTDASGVRVSVGIDMAETARIGGLVRKFGHRFLRKIFSDEEIVNCERSVNSVASFAARFAAKEAFSKALGTGIGKFIGWKDVSVGKMPSGAPYVILSEGATLVLRDFGFSEAKISLSHTKTLAQAIVVLI